MLLRRKALGVACLAAACVVSVSSPCRGADGDTRKKAERVSAYVTLAETITRVGLQVGGMLERHPYDRPLMVYARDLGRLHAKAMVNLTPPEGAEDVHRHFKEAVACFALAADAHCSGDFPTARTHREKCAREFNRALIEVIKLRKEGAIP